MSKRVFGTVRKLPSGRWQVRYPGLDGLRRAAPGTFATKADADAHLAEIRTDMARGRWIDPDRSKVRFEDFAARWQRERTDLRPRTVELYARLLRRQINPYLGSRPLSSITTDVVRTWHAELTTVHQEGVSTTAKAYRLLRVILATAVVDGLMPRNPCQIRGAGVERPRERTTATVDQVYALADAVRPRFRAFVLLAAFSGCRWGELVALTRRRLDLDRGTVEVASTWVEPSKGKPFAGPTKTEAGQRTVALPPTLAAELRAHLDAYAASGQDGLVFPGVKGAVISRRNFNKAAGWRAACESAGLPDFHFHDLRHTANGLAAEAGANLAELMDRMGHASMRAALVYLHATDRRGAAIARAMDATIAGNRNGGKGLGTDRARGPSDVAEPNGDAVA
ncbi:site-specific integrase [Frankia sp. Cj5]|uniref:tyrosine-type recombinase/integrase n=1 Tax=Frankia sp. Cj5 TaxID=2880978 RepID=UPI001EF4C315|nr:site-specific integrase [Frankia sp. Cj5]